MATVQFLVSSGLPNPTKVLSAAAKAHVLGRLKSLGERVDAPHPPNLTDSGVLVECDAGDGVAAFIAFDGVVSVFGSTNEQPIHYRDPENSIATYIRKQFGR